MANAFGMSAIFVSLIFASSRVVVPGVAALLGVVTLALDVDAPAEAEGSADGAAVDPEPDFGTGVEVTLRAELDDPSPRAHADATSRTAHARATFRVIVELTLQTPCPVVLTMK